MSEYRRFISYIYHYANGRKEMNCGYVKAEIRGNICRLQLHVERNGQKRGPLSVYGFVREEEYLLGLMLGETAGKGNTCDFQTATAAQHFADTGYSAQQIRGIWLTGEDGETYITVWDDEPVDPERFVTELPQREEKEEPDGEETEEIPAAPELKAEEINGQPEKKQHALESRWPQFCYHYPAMRVFADEEFCECLQIAPKDISFLGESQWSYSQSPFVRQAAAKYHHLMLGRHQDGRFMLAVPGVYGDMQNRQLARMYGFPIFKEAAAEPGIKAAEAEEMNLSGERTEIFGYWYHFIE